MPKVKVLRPHAYTQGIGVYKRGDVYNETPHAAKQKADAGFVQFVESKESPAMYRRLVVEEEVTLKDKKGNWYTFSDGDRVIGKTKAAEKLGVSVEEVEELAENVSSDDE